MKPCYWGVASISLPKKAARALGSAPRHPPSEYRAVEHLRTVSTSRRARSYHGGLALRSLAASLDSG